MRSSSGKGGQQGPPLSREEEEALLAIPDWECWASQQVLVPWEQRCSELAAFVRQYGRLPRKGAGKSKPFLPGEKVLGKWCDKQRQRWNGKRQPQLKS